MSRTGSRHQCGRWTNAEDEILICKVRAQELLGQPKDWSSIAAIISGRSNKDCRKRWVRLNGCIKKGEWSSIEDIQLRDAFEKFGARWVQVSRYIKTRSADQCAARWQNYLDPNIKRQKWSHDEDQRLLQAYCIHGSNWKMIQMHELMDRSLQDIRNRYKSLFRLCSRSNAPPFIPSTANLGIIDHIHDLSPMPSYEMFSQNSPHYTPNDITTFVAEDPSASTCCTTPTADDSTSANGEIICYENIDEFCRLWSHLDSTTDFESPIQWNDQQNNVSLPIAESTDSTHNSTTGHIEVVFNNSAWFGDKHNT
ncbi:Homeodomain-like protein [Trichoderma sp. SZMC 28013]